MADLKDIVGKNREFTGASGIKTSSSATTANRVNEKGRLRFNDTTDLMEYYTGVDWKFIDTPPVVTSLQIDGKTDALSQGTSVAIDSTKSGNATIIITGDFFDSGASVVFVPSSGSNVSVSSTTFIDGQNISVTVPYSSFAFANEPYSARVQNSSGLFASGASLTVDTPLVFNNAADHIAQIFDSSRGSVNISDFQATDPENDTITYSITAGSIPSGLTLNANGTITGATSAVGANTDNTFTMTAVSSSAKTSTTTSVSRQFIIRQMAPVQTSYTSGSGTFSVPSGLSSVDVLVVGNGGNAGGSHSGGGGGGGLIFRPGLPVTPGGSVPYSFGTMIGRNDDTPGTRNGDVVFGPLTAIAGGHGRNGGGGPPSSNTAAQAGGSGAGGTHSPSGTHGGNPAIQPLQSGDSGTYGFGHPGGQGSHSPGNHASGGGGGGAGAAGTGPSNSNPAGSGGAGKAYTISGSSVHYAGGGAGGNHNGGSPGSGGTGGGGGNGGDGTNGLGGGAGSNNEPSSPGFIGGTGVIWISY